ncbi:MAG: histidine phosphatase family protein [Candidatus Uhrbacteria bacterium]|nr:histidine phosphatase family protein [Candidatus Uhrbacteria bacterium]
MIVLVARHGETPWNVAGVIQGKTDIPMNERGKEQIRSLGRNIERISVIICSDLVRSVEAAQLVAETHPVPIRLDSRLRECDYGKLEGMTRAGASATFGIDMSDDEHVHDFRPYGGELIADVVARQIAMLTELRGEAHAYPSLLIGHGGALTALLRKFYLKLPRQGEYVSLAF